MNLQLNRKHFINQYPPFNLITSNGLEDLSKKRELLLYIHIPFCPKKCGYCYYKSTDNYTEEIVQRYCEFLKKEITLFADSPENHNRIIRSLYFGGGTPSILSNKQYQDLVEFIYSKFEFISDFEFCSEARPHVNCIDKEKLKLMKALGVNRLSMGMQSLDNNILMVNQRDGNIEFYEKVINLARECGFNYINIDIMSGMISENWESWERTLDLLIKWAPESIAIYKMELFYNTKLYQDYRNGLLLANNIMSDREEIKYIKYAYKKLEEQAQYQAINCLHLAKDEKYRDTHYTSLWKGIDMKGFGISSHSCCSGFIHQNTPQLGEYFSMLESEKLPIKRAYKLTPRDKISEAMVYGLKNLLIKRNDFIERFGFDFTIIYADTINDLQDKGILELTDDHLRILPDYYVFTDDICREFFLPEYKTMMLAQVDRSFE